MANITVKNNATGVESTFTEAAWKKTKENPMFKNTFSLVEKPEVPEELKTKSQPAAAAADKEDQADKTQDKKQDKNK